MQSMTRLTLPQLTYAGCIVVSMQLDERTGAKSCRQEVYINSLMQAEMHTGVAGVPSSRLPSNWPARCNMFDAVSKDSLSCTV